MARTSVAVRSVVATAVVVAVVSAVVVVVAMVTPLVPLVFIIGTKYTARYHVFQGAMFSGPLFCLTGNLHLT
jgi:hypothetical protein